VLANIAATRAALGGRLSVWKEPRVVQLTKARLLIAPGSVRAVMIERKVAAEHEGSWTDGAIMALSFGLAILTAIPTGGSSLVGAVVVAADIAGAVADVYLVVDHLRAFRIDQAKAGTDLDAQARAISIEHPSMFWLAFDLVATGVGLSAAARTFKTIAGDLARAERAIAKGAPLSVAEADVAAARIHRLAREGKLSADVAERAEGQLRLAAGAESASSHVATEGTPEVAGEAGPKLARHDTRARVSPEHLGELEQRLGVPVVLDEALSNGVELHYVRRPGRLGIGTDIEPTAVRVGRSALLDDILVHRTTIARVTRYNGVVGKLRGLWDRLLVDTAGINPFRPGQRGWEAFEELRKIDELIELRRSQWNPASLDPQTLDEEITFLEGRRAYHEELVQAAHETGAIQGIGHIDASDIGKVTDEARAKGYKLPGADEGMNPDWYYYRDKRNVPGEYELVVKPSAPDRAKRFRAVTKDGKFQRLELGEPPRPQTHLTGAWTDAEVIDHLWADESFAPFAALLLREKLATRAEINAAIATRSANRTKLPSLIDDTVRRNVKDVFRPRLVERLIDPALDAKASWKRMRQMLDGLDSSDRGNLVELWYQGRNTKQAQLQVPVNVLRTGDKAGVIEVRQIDLVDGNCAIEIKDVIGRIDRDQLDAYLDMVGHETTVTGKIVKIKKVRYVFTRPEGARANLGLLAIELRNARVAARLSIEVFDATGARRTVTTEKGARTLLSELGGPL
jgi:hypothetical protein